MEEQDKTTRIDNVTAPDKVSAHSNIDATTRADGQMAGNVIRANAAQIPSSTTHGSTLGITDSKSSPLNDSSTVCLFAKSEMVSFLDSLVAPMGLINALIAAVGVQDRQRTFDTFRELEQIWKEYGVYQIDED